MRLESHQRYLLSILGQLDATFWQSNTIPTHLDLHGVRFHFLSLNNL
ncbi:MAG: hypothetical protein O3A87_11045 [Verrucomicrobia bacterium]|nr:hypothetical protein [Verrucomicrobiota bacterium]MDA1006998.1 hypothetical protein [Verrucomicrobiota bacterium]